MPPATLPALFAAQAQRTPAATAVVFEDRRLSYAELDAHANQLAHHLRGQGIGPETVVGLLVERSPEMLIGLFGILKAGAAYLPLDPGYPAERLAFMLRDASAAALVTQAALPGRLDLPTAGPLIRLDADWAEVARQPTTAPATALEPGHAAYVIYTSGSTGTPKGVVVTHANLANKMLALGREFGVDQQFRAALFISCSFDAAIEQTLLPFMGGGAAVVISDAVRELPAAFWRQINQTAVTFISCVPSYLETMLVERPERVSLRHLALGGEAFTVSFRDKIARSLEVSRITNLYGPTETTIDAIGYAVTGDETGTHVPIGRAFPNYRVYVLDGGLEPVAAGVVGRALHRGAWCCAGLSGPAGAYGGAVCCGPAWGAWQPDVPQRRSGALAR